MSQTFTKSYKAILCSFIGAASLLTIVSCSKGSDKKSTVRLKDRYIKMWTASDQCQSSSSASYPLNISDNAAGEDRLTIGNIQNRGGSLDAIVSTNGDVTIPGQRFLTTDTTIQGYIGYHSSTKIITLSVNYTYNGITYNSCYGTAY